MNGEVDSTKADGFKTWKRNEQKNAKQNLFYN